MIWRPKHLTRSQREERRLEAGRLLQAGQLSHTDIARRLGVSRMAVSTWARQLRQHHGDMASLHTRPIPGRPAHLSGAQWPSLPRIDREARSGPSFPKPEVQPPVVEFPIHRLPNFTYLA
jgi:transposase-like protein